MSLLSNSSGPQRFCAVTLVSSMRAQRKCTGGLHDFAASSTMADATSFRARASDTVRGAKLLLKSTRTTTEVPSGPRARVQAKDARHALTTAPSRMAYKLRFLLIIKLIWGRPDDAQAAR